MESNDIEELTGETEIFIFLVINSKFVEELLPIIINLKVH
jgi:hypothetical protein